MRAFNDFAATSHEDMLKDRRAGHKEQPFSGSVHIAVVRKVVRVDRVVATRMSDSAGVLPEVYECALEPVHVDVLEADEVDLASDSHVVVRGAAIRSRVDYSTKSLLIGRTSRWCAEKRVRL